MLKRICTVIYIENHKEHHKTNIRKQIFLTMAAYVIVEVSIQDPNEYEAYKKLTPAAVAAYNGKFIVRGGQTETLEGEWQPERIVIIEFPTVERAKEWWNSEIYAKAKAIRQRAAKSKMIVVSGV